MSMKAAMIDLVKRSRTKSQSSNGNQMTLRCAYFTRTSSVTSLETKDFRHSRKISSIMSAKGLSIMPTNAGRVTVD